MMTETGNELNPELEKAILQLLPGCDRGLIRSMIRIYFMREQFCRSRGRAGSVLVLDISPEGRIAERPRWFAEVK